MVTTACSWKPNVLTVQGSSGLEGMLLPWQDGGEPGLDSRGMQWLWLESPAAGCMELHI